jgi:predicted secreted protein
MRKAAYAAVLAGALLAASCGRQVTDPSVPIEVDPGEEFELVLSADGETGYHWELLQTLDQTMLRFVEKTYEGSGLSLSSPGKTGCEVWRFRTVGVGETSIRIGYLAPPGVDFSSQDSVLVYTVRVSR